MDSTLLIVIVPTLTALAAGVLLGFLWAHLRAAARLERLRLELEVTRVRLESATREETGRVALLEQSEARLRAAVETMSSEALRTNSELFLQLARESLGKEQALAQGALRERETAIAGLIEPLRSALDKADIQAQTLERERRDALAMLHAQIETLASGQTQLQRETRNLVTALRRPEVRGRWGELTLRRLVELAGMTEHCDFTEQVHVGGEEGAVRPDLVVHMPDARDIVVDVKTPLDAFLEALEADSEEARTLAMKRHAQQVETRVRQLAAKSYWMQFEHSPEFAVLFLPGDQFLGSALAERPELLDNALKQGVIIATPSTFIALLKVVAHSWRQSAVAQNAALIRELAEELYRRLGSFTAHLARLGQRLSAAVEAHDAAVGSLERQVLPQARRFTELGATAEAPLPELEPIARIARAPAAATVTPESEADVGNA
jgi:DNA recombination protein RmuC